ncbi:MAG: 4-(cytidine 5'-diphospho)-2-C-methyl-D-erythritol kinase [Burkholderiaceae bacterium]
MELLLALPAPAKLNLFLHVIGRRADGYHELQTAYTLIGLADVLDFERRIDDAIVREGDLVGSIDDDLAVRAARALNQFAGTAHGVTIGVTKRIPAGSGMGGGSSDAATTLIALNRLWDLRLSRSQLSAIGVRLGADVPFFLHGRNAYAEGVGERLTTIDVEPTLFAVIWPGVHVSTRDIFDDPGLTRNSKAMKIAALSAAAGGLAGGLAGESAGGAFAFSSLGADELKNDLESVARRRFPAIDEALNRLERFGVARMTGSGSAVFIAAESRQRAQLAVADLPPEWCSWVVEAVNEHPLAVW